MKQFKLLITLAALVLLSANVDAQYLRTSYFMEGTSYRMQLNPALTPKRGYIQAPVFGALNATINSSSIGYKDIIDIIENSNGGDYFMNNDFIDKLKTNNNINLNLNVNVISAGWYSGKNFWSFNINLRNNLGIKIPKNMFEFMRDMNTLCQNDYSNLETNPSAIEPLLGLDKRVDKQSVYLKSFTEIGVGFARDITDRLTIGGRFKFLLGNSDMSLHINNIRVHTPSEMTIDKPVSAGIEVDATLRNSSQMLKLVQENDYISDAEFGKVGFCGYGTAIDLGASFRVLDRLTISAGITDLGFISWNKKHTQTATARANQEYNLANQSELMEFTDLVSSGEILNLDMIKMSFDEESADNYKSALTSTVSLGAEYELVNKWLAFGALYTTHFTKPKSINELTFSANVRPGNAFNASLSYSVLQGEGKTFGVALKLGPVFLGTDYMFLGKNTKNINAFIGSSIAIGAKKGERK